MTRTKEEATQFKKDLLKQAEDSLLNITSSDDFKKYLTQMSNFHNYSFDNICMILSQNPKATRVAGFKTWKEKFNRQVQKGSKAIYIKAPITKKLTEEEKSKLGTKDDYSVVGFRLVPVFDISNTEGDPILSAKDFVNNIDIEKNKEVYSFYKLKEVAKYIEKEYGIPVTFDNFNDKNLGGFYTIKDHSITINTNKKSYTSQLKTLFHEFSHAILHNAKDGEHKDVPTSVKEVQAEASAFLAMQAQQIDTSNYSLGYIATWGKDVEIIKNSLKEINNMFNINLDIIDKTVIDLEQGLLNEKNYERICQVLGTDLSNTNYASYHEYFFTEIVKDIEHNLKNISPNSIISLKDSIGEEATELLAKDEKIKSVLTVEQNQPDKKKLENSR